jgi:anti-anti-sigma factor
METNRAAGIATVPVNLRPSSNDLISTGSNYVIADLAAVPRIDSSGVGELIQAQGTLTRAGGRLVLLRCSNVVKRVLRAAGVEVMFDCFEDEQSARDSFNPANLAEGRARLAGFLGL